MTTAGEFVLPDGSVADVEPLLLDTWCQGAAGHADDAAARALVALLAPGDPRAAAARARLA